MKIALLTIVTFLAACFSAASQPTLTAAMLNPVDGETFYGHRVDNNAVNAGLSGGNVNWSYINLHERKLDTTSFFTCDATPYCIIYQGHNDNGRANSNLAYNSTDKLFSMAGYNLAFGSSIPSMQYGKAYSYAFKDTIVNPETKVTRYHNEIDSYYYDGYGTLYLPTGAVQDVSRIHTVAYTFDSSKGNINAARTEYFTWYKAGFHNPLMVIKYDTVGVAGGKPHVTYASYYTTQTNSTSVPDARALAASLQVYPVQVNNQLHITYNLKGILVSAIYITDLTGKVIATIKTDNLSDGAKDITYPLDAFLPGTYFVHLASSVGRISKQVVLTRPY